jgi:glucokinase
LELASNSVALVADVGGSHLQAALAWINGDARPHLHPLRIQPTPNGRLQAVLSEHLKVAGLDSVGACAVAAAGRVLRMPERSFVRMTSSALTIDLTDLEEATGASRVFLLNDLAAVAASLPLLRADELIAIGVPRPVRAGVRLVIGIDRALGAAVLTADGSLLETEAGQLDLAAVSADERQWLNRLAPLGRLSIETLISASGLARLYEVLSGVPHVDVASIAERAEAGEAQARKTMIVFSTWLGRAVGNLVLAYGAWNGVYLIGSVLDHLGLALDEAAFRKGMEDKAPVAAEINAVPVYRIRHPNPSLLGLAHLALTPTAQLRN